jgi:heptosyltransferase I
LKILILKPSSLGDVIHALPVLRLLKSHLPQSEIYWWLDAGLAPLLEGDRDLAGVIRFERKRWSGFARWPEMLASLRAMRAKQFDWAIDLQGLARSGIFAWLSNAKLVVGLDNPREGAREGAHAFYDLRPLPARADTHAVDRYLAVLPLLKVPVHWNFTWLPPRPDVAAQIDKKWNPGPAPRILLLPGARWNNKRWPVENFVALVRRLRAATDLRFAVLGGNEDRALGQAIASDNPGRCLDLTGQTSLWEMIEWLRRSRLIIANDTGPVHVAAALGKPLIALFGPTAPKSTGPYGMLSSALQVTDLPCVPCYKSTCTYQIPLACLHGIQVETVYKKALEQLAAKGLKKPEDATMSKS